MIEFCHVDAAWRRPPPTTRGRRLGDGSVVAHPDTGYTRHDEIDDPRRLLVSAGYDFEDRRTDPRDPLTGASPGHGTSTASVIMSDIGRVRAGRFVTGVAPLAKLVPLRVASSVIHLSFENLARAIYFAADAGHHVISMSLGGPIPADYLLAAIRYAVRRGVILIAAAGNVWPRVVYPAAYDEVIAVAACDCAGHMWRWSATGAAVDVTAPGDGVWRAKIDAGGADVEPSSGTSYATAMVAGACALWLAYHDRRALIAKYGAENLAAVFKEVLIARGVRRPVGWPRGCGAGILDVDRLLAARLPDTPPAAGVRALHAAPVARRQSDFDAIASYFPGVAPRRVRAALCALLRTDERNLGIVLADVGDELRFHVATDPVLRESLARGARSAAARARATRRTARGAGAAPRARLLRAGSRGLRRYLRPSAR